MFVVYFDQRVVDLVGSQWRSGRKDYEFILGNARESEDISMSY